MSVKEEYQQKLHEVEEASGDGPGYSYRRFTRRVK